MTPVSLADLWLPILAAWIGVHAVSTLAWTALPHHKPEWKHFPWAPVDEAARAHGAEPGGQYLLSAGEADDRDPGKCRGMLILWRHTPSMGVNIGLTLAFFLVAAVGIGLLASLGLPREASPGRVFGFTLLAGLLTHAAAGVPSVIWFRRRFAMDLLDGVAYALVTGLAFAALWPS